MARNIERPPPYRLKDALLDIRQRRMPKFWRLRLTFFSLALFSCALFLPWPIIFLSSFLMFDAPGSSNDPSVWFTVVAINSYPLYIFAFLLFGWVLHRKGYAFAGLTLAGVPLVVTALLAVTLFEEQLFPHKANWSKAAFEREIDKKLVRAAYDGDMRKMKSLVEKGASLNAFNGSLYPLSAAYAGGKPKTLKALLEMGADPNFVPQAVTQHDGHLLSITRTNDDGTKSVSYGRSGMGANVATLLINNTIYGAATPEERLAMLADLFDFGLNPKLTDGSRNIADTIQFIFDGDIINLLLEKNVDFNGQNPEKPPIRRWIDWRMKNTDIILTVLENTQLKNPQSIAIALRKAQRSLYFNENSCPDAWRIDTHLQARYGLKSSTDPRSCPKARTSILATDP